MVDCPIDTFTAIEEGLLNSNGEPQGRLEPLGFFATAVFVTKLTIALASRESTPAFRGLHPQPRQWPAVIADFTSDS